MNYLEFRQYVVDHIKEFLPPEYQSCNVFTEHKMKNNNVRLWALFILGKECAVPAIYLEPYYRNYIDGEKMENILQNITQVYLESTEAGKSITRGSFQYDAVKDKIFVTVQNAGMNQEFLKNVPHEIREDLALSYRIAVDYPDKGTVVINDNLLDTWGIGKEELKEVAWSNMHEHFKPSFSSMGEVLKVLGVEDLPEGIDEVEMYVLTNEERYYGAAYMFDKEVMQMIADQLNSDVVILPSSVHETLLLKLDDQTDFEHLENTVQEMNSNVLQTVEILSDHVYLYSKETQHLSRVNTEGLEEAEMTDTQQDIMM